MPFFWASTKPSKMRAFVSEMRAASSRVGTPVIPRSCFWNDPRWSKASM